MIEFETKFINETDRPKRIWESGMAIRDVLPRKSAYLTAIDPTKTFARWSEVKWTQSGDVILTARKGFVEPDRGPYILMLLNKDGRDVEFRKVGGGSYVLMKGIPYLAAIDISDDAVFIAAFEIKICDNEIRTAEFPGYVWNNRILRNVTTPRSDEEIAKIKKLREELKIKNTPLAADISAPRTAVTASREA